MNHAPIAVFAYNRPDHLKNLISSLLLNPEASSSDLYVFVDGPKSELHREMNEAVKRVASSVSGFKSVNCIVSEVNKGLSKSIITGVTSVIGEYGRIIVLEDDLIVAPSFLHYMNTALESYADDDSVMQVTGFSTKFHMPASNANEVYLNRRSGSWSWGTWSDRWDTVDWMVKDHAEFYNDRKALRAFSSIGSDLPGMLERSLSGKNDSWAIRFAYSMFRQGKYTVCPIRSLVMNDGFGTEATHCRGYNRYKVDYDDSGAHVRIPRSLVYDRRADRRANRYWSLPYRFVGKMMSIIHQ